MIDAMQASEETDAEVAIRVMGWRRGRLNTALWYHAPLGEQYAGHHVSEWAPSYDIADAMDVIEHMRSHGHWTVQIRTDGDDHDVWCVTFRLAEVHHAKAATLPLAICRAALKACTA